MDVITRKIEALKRINKNIGNYISIVINDEKAIILDMNTEDQLYEQGINNLGVEIMDYKPYQEFTISVKLSKGQPTNRVTLRDSGEFHRSFDLEITDNYFKIIATDDNTEQLIKRYGRQILGLTYENQNELIWSYIYDALLEQIKNEL